MARDVEMLWSEFISSPHAIWDENWKVLLLTRVQFQTRRWQSYISNVPDVTRTDRIIRILLTVTMSSISSRGKQSRELERKWQDCWAAVKCNQRLCCLFLMKAGLCNYNEGGWSCWWSPRLYTAIMHRHIAWRAPITSRPEKFSQILSQQ